MFNCLHLKYSNTVINIEVAEGDPLQMFQKLEQNNSHTPKWIAISNFDWYIRPMVCICIGALYISKTTIRDAYIGFNDHALLL